MFSRTQRLVGRAAAIALATAVPCTAFAVEFDFKGSLGEAGFTHYVAPISNPIFSETPYITTEIRPIWIHQDISNHFVTGGGNIDVIAAQIRVALTDRLGFIATKDGWADVDFDSVLQDENGAVNLAFGMKYAVIAQPETNSLLTVALRYEAPSGHIRSSGIRLQGQGDGLIDLLVTGARTFGSVGLQGNLGAQMALDNDTDASFLHYSIHADYDVANRFFPVLEMNGYTPINEGNRTSVGANGMDLVNLGSTDAKTILTVAPGFRVRIVDNVDFGTSFEIPMTKAEDLMNWRFTTDLVIHL